MVPFATKNEREPSMKDIEFDPVAFLMKSGAGRQVGPLKAKHVLFSQGSPADAIFYLQRGTAKLTVISKTGKEATIALLSAGEFVGEESITTVHGLRLATATALTSCTALKSGGRRWSACYTKSTRSLMFS